MKPYQRGNVVIIDVPMLANSHIQAGKRPWVIVQNNVGNQFSPTTIVVPLTTKIKRLELPTHAAVTWGSLQPSMVECEQVRVVDVSDDWEYICIWCKSNGYFACSAKRFNADMETHPEWHGGKVVYQGYPVYKNLRLKGAS